MSWLAKSIRKSSSKAKAKRKTTKSSQTSFPYHTRSVSKLLQETKETPCPDPDSDSDSDSDSSLLNFLFNSPCNSPEPNMSDSEQPQLREDDDIEIEVNRPKDETINLLGDTDNESDSQLSDDEDDKIATIARVLNAQSISERNIKRIGQCDGSSTSKTLKWLRALDEMDSPVILARNTAEGALASHIRTRKKLNWRELRRSIAENFISAAFQSVQKDALENLAQRASESLNTFNFEFETLVRDAYDKLPENQDNLIRTYLSALHDRRLAESVVRSKPDTLREAMKQTVQRDRTSEYLKPRKTGKVSELTPVVSSKIDTLASAVGSLINSQKALVGQINQIKGESQQAVKVPPKPQSKQQVTCFRCKKQGHYAKDCRVKLTYEKPQARQSDAVTCARCRENTHTVRNCRAGPPKSPCYCGGSHWLYDCPERQRPTSNVPKQGNSQLPQPARLG